MSDTNPGTVAPILTSDDANRPLVLIEDGKIATLSDLAAVPSLGRPESLECGTVKRSII